MGSEPQTSFMHCFPKHTAFAFEIYNNKSETRPYLKLVDLTNEAESDEMKMDTDEYSNFQLMLGFGTSPRDFDELEKRRVVNALCHVLRENVSFIVTYSEGLVGSKVDAAGVRRALELENKRFICMSMLLLPKMDKVKFQKIEIQESATGDFQKLIGINNEDLKDLRAILLLMHSSQAGGRISNALTTFLKEHSHVVLAGGKVPVLISDTGRVLGATGILVFGDDQNVKVDCKFIRSTSEADLKPEMNQLKSLLMEPTSAKSVGSFAVMLGSTERRQDLFGRPGVEAGCFQEIFPLTKLVGTVAADKFAKGSIDSTITKRTNASLFFVVSYVI